MPWRYFYSTEESDTALKAILAGQDYISGSALVKGVYEYKILLDHDSDYAVLANKIALSGIRAIASPERISQFGNILTDNFFDTSQYAAGCSLRQTLALSEMVDFLNAYVKTGHIFAQRDIDIQGSASLGTIALILSSVYQKTYNVPVNGSVSDRTLVKVVKDSTSLSVTETNAVCNQAMFDFQVRGTRKLSSTCVQGPGWNTMPSVADTILYAEDGSISTYPATDYRNATISASLYIYFDYGSIVTGDIVGAFTFIDLMADATFKLYYSQDAITWTLGTTLAGVGAGTKKYYTSVATKTFRYVKCEVNIGTTACKMRVRELWVYL